MGIPVGEEIPLIKQLVPDFTDPEHGEVQKRSQNLIFLIVSLPPSLVWKAGHLARKRGSLLRYYFFSLAKPIPRASPAAVAKAVSPVVVVVSFLRFERLIYAYREEAGTTPGFNKLLPSPSVDCPKQ